MADKKLKLDFVKVAGDLTMKVTRVAICSGSGSSLMQAFLSSKSKRLIIYSFCFFLTSFVFPREIKSKAVKIV